MRPAVIIAILLGINVALLSTVGYLIYVIKKEPPPREKAVEVKRTAPTPARRMLARPGYPPGVNAPAPAPPFNWAQVESTDFKLYIANLRAIHCPEETIQDIIMAEVEKLYNARRKNLFPPRSEAAFWVTGPGSIENEWADRERQKQLRALDKEKQDLLTELLGVDAQALFQKIYGNDTYYDSHLSFLPEEKQELARAILQKFQDQEQELYQQADADMLDEDQAKFKREISRITAEKQAELARILTPEELEKYELVSSEVAAQMRSDLTGFEPNEQEFRAIFNVRKQFEEQTAVLSEQGSGEATEKARQVLDAELRKVLGDARYREYQRSQDEAYRGAMVVAEKLNLPKQSAVQVYDMKQLMDQQAQRILANGQLSPEQQQMALRSVADETTRALQQTLGERGFRAYQRNGGGWLQEYSELANSVSIPGTEDSLRLGVPYRFP